MKLKTINTVAHLDSELSKYRAKGKTIGFVPTMGALHDGHMTLMRASMTENDITVCSIFVNPTQFNEKTDLEKYPRTLDADKVLLEREGVDILFFPSVAEIYPKGMKTKVEMDFGSLAEVMEGAFRPGHFDGVAEVVKRLLEIVLPHALYMGQKDFQQFTIINYMISSFEMDVELVVVPIVREPSGLAMSSRNRRLSTQELADATLLYKTLKAVNRKKYKMPVKELESYAMGRLSKKEGFRPEYFTICDGRTLQSLALVEDSDYVVACVACWVGDVRLIDNMILRKPRKRKNIKSNPRFFGD